jgi:Protein of unknown function (DUF4240)
VKLRKLVGAVRLRRLVGPVALAALVVGGWYVATHTDDLARRLGREKDRISAALEKRFESEKDQAAAAVKEGLENERDKAVGELKTGLERERDRVAAEVKKGLEAERDRDVAGAKEGAQKERDRDVAGAKEGAQTERDRDAAAVNRGVKRERERDVAAVKKGISNERDLAAERRASARMDEAAFWDLIAETRTAAANDTTRQSALLKERLSRLSPQEIIDFAEIHDRLDEGAATSDLWGAAFVIEDGCADDCFGTFRSYLISLGQDPYERALADPDSLASVRLIGETGEWPNAENAAPEAYASVTGAELPVNDSDSRAGGTLNGASLVEDDPAVLASRYPQLVARFR